MKIAQPIQMVQKVIGWLLMAGGVGAAATAGASLVLHLTNFNARDIRQDHQTTLGPNSPATHNETHGPNSPIHSGDTITIKIDNSKTYNYKAGDIISFSIIEVNKAENTISMRFTPPQTTNTPPGNPQPSGSTPGPNAPVTVLPSGGGPAGNQGFNRPQLGPTTIFNPSEARIYNIPSKFGLTFSSTPNQVTDNGTPNVPGAPIYLPPNVTTPENPHTSPDAEEPGLLEKITNIFFPSEPEDSSMGGSCPS